MAPEVIKTAGQPGAQKAGTETVAAKAAGGEKAPVLDVPKEEPKKDASTTAGAAPVNEAASVEQGTTAKAGAPPAPAPQPMLEDDVEADRVAKQLFDADH